MTAEPRRFSNSEIQTFKDCRRKWWLTYYRKLGLKAKEVLGPRPIGTGVHHALATHYAGTGDPIHALHALHKEWEAHLSADGKDLKKFRSQAELQQIMVEGYFQWLEEIGADSDLEVVDTETYLESPLDIPGYGQVLLIGKIDLRVRKKHNGAYLIVDHKTMVNFDTYMYLLRSNEQMLHYHLLELLQDTGAKTDGAMYNMLRKVKRTATAKPPFYDRVEIRHNPHQMSSYVTRLTATIQDILSLEKRLQSGESHQAVAYPRPNDSCHWKCDFFAACSLFDDGSRAEDMLRMVYTEIDPLDRYSEQDSEAT